MNTIEIGKRIKKIRESLGKSQYVLARDYGISKNTQVRYENGELPSTLLDALYTYHNLGKVSYDFLLDGKEQSLEDVQLFSQINRLSEEQKKLVREFISLLSNKPTQK